jgi:heme-degrading monooxygenase HmoA
MDTPSKVLELTQDGAFSSASWFRSYGPAWLASSPPDMILEVAILDVRSGQEASFEKDFATASQYISSVPGYLSHELQRCVEKSNRFILLARWTHLEAHTKGFRGSPQYSEWKRMLHDYYDPFPTVEHYASVYTQKA